MTEFLTPEEVQLRKEQKQRKPPVSTQVINIEEDDYVEEQIIAKNHAGKIELNFETMGRFDTPATVFFDDYTTEHVTKLSLCNEDNILETIVAILNDIKESDKEFRVEDMLLEEFLEVMIAIKQEFETPAHIHKWICECQYDKPENEMLVNELLINLRDLRYTTITEADEALKDYYREQYKKFSSTQFKEMMMTKYKDNPLDDYDNYTVEDEIKNTEIKDAYQVFSKEDCFTFRFRRVKDLLQAQKLSNKKYSSKIKQIENKQWRKNLNIEIAKFKEEKEEELKQIKKLMSEEALNYANALSITHFNGREITNPEEKIELYKTMTRGAMFSQIDFLDEIKFGINTKVKFTCDHCENGHGDKSNERYLRREFFPFEFIPINSDTENKLRSNTRGIVFM